MEPEIDKSEGMSSSDTHDHDQQQSGGMPPPQRPYGRIDREHPIDGEGEMSDIVRGLLRHIRLPWLTQHYARTPVLAIFSFLNSCISIGLMSTLALITGSDFIIPRLERPRSPFTTHRSRLPPHRAIRWLVKQSPCWWVTSAWLSRV